jgi:hypothetical protein
VRLAFHSSSIFPKQKIKNKLIKPEQQKKNKDKFFQKYASGSLPEKLAARVRYGD